MTFAAALQALQVIPRSPSLTPLANRNIEDLSIEEMRDIIRRERVSARPPALNLISTNIVPQSEQARKAADIKRIKRERAVWGDDDEDNDNIVSAPRPIKKRRVDPDDVVDLCYDD